MSQALPSNQGIISIFGTENNPIDILDQNDQKNLYDNLLEISRNQEIIKKALLCKTSLDIVFAIIMTKFPGQFFCKQQCLKKEIVQYFYDKIKINILYQSFTPRLQPDYSNDTTKPFGIALIIHGVDFMDTRQIGKMFSSPIEGLKGIIQKIIWIDDSNVEIVFMNPQIAQAVIEKLTSDVKKDKVKMQEQQSTQFPKGWFELNSYNIFGIPRKLFARYITTLQLDIKKANSLNRYTIFENAQKGLQLYLLTKFQAFEDFQKIMKQIEYEKYGKSILSQTRYFHHIKPLMGDQRKLDQYMTQGKKHLNLKLNFQGQRQKNQIAVPKGQEGNEVMQVDNPLDISLIQRNGINEKLIEINVNDISVIENNENVMINEDENVLINNIISEISKDKGVAMIDEEADKHQIMNIEKPDLIQVEKQFTSKTSQKAQKSFSNDTLMNLLKQISQLNSVPSQENLKIDPENLKLIINQLAAQQDTTTTTTTTTKNVVAQKQKKQTEIIQNTSIDLTKYNNQTNVPLQNDNQVNKKQGDLQNYDPYLNDLTKKNETNSLENKGSNLNSSNRGYKQSNQGYQKPTNADFKGKNSSNNYQKNQSKPSLPDYDFQEPISY